jgi:hypothetical protein
MFAMEFSTILSKKDMHRPKRRRVWKLREISFVKIIYICKATFLEDFKYIAQL